MNKIACWIAAVLLLAAMNMGTAHAVALTDAQIFSQFNAVIFGNFSSTADVEGRTVVGGDLQGGATFNLNPAGVAASSFSALTVYGNATSGGTYNITNGGGVTIAGNNNVTFSSLGSAYVGGTNSGGLSLTGGSGSLTVVGANSGTLSLASGGSVYVGGNSGTINSGGYTALSINGNNNSSNVNLNGGAAVQLNGSNNGTLSLSGGSVTYTGSKGNMNLNGGATATQVGSLTLTPPSSTLSSFATTFQALNSLSAQLNAVKANSTATSSGGAIAFNAAPVNGVAVFDVNTALFAPNSTVTINLGGATSVIINVSVSGCVTGPCAFTMPNNVNFSSPTGYAATVLWNFINATNLTFTNEFGGSVLAPLAAVSNSSPIDGTLVAASYSGTGELHSHPYTGTFPGGSTPAPEPASLAVIGTALAGLAAVRRKRKARALPLQRHQPDRNSPADKVAR